MAETIAITGANGFLGRHCILEALSIGLNVRGIVRRQAAADIVKGLRADPIIVRNFDETALSNAFRDCVGVLHLIGIVNEAYGSFQDINVRGTQKVLDAAHRNQVSRFVTPSGLGVDQYGKKPWATNGYFASKRDIEGLCQSSPVPYILFRPSYILGPGDELIPQLVSAIQQGTVLVAGEGNAPMQPIYVKDAATVFIRATIGRGPSNTIYDLVGPETITFLQLVSRVAQWMAAEGFTIPPYQVQHVPLHEAPRILGISKEEIDVMSCDVMGDYTPFTQEFQVSLTPLDEAVRAAVRAERVESG